MSDVSAIPKMRKVRKRIWIQRLGAALVLICLTAAGVNAIAYVAEKRWIERRAAEVVGRAGAQTREEQVRALQAYVRKAVDYHGAPYEGRPFLRSTARETLELGLGYCGEATRAFIALARARGISAQRMNLHGSINHVVPEVELAPGDWRLIDTQEAPATNRVLDPRWVRVDEVIGVPGSPFVEFSNVNLRRLPVVNRVVTRVKLDSPELTWVLESPQLMKAIFFGGIAFALLTLWIVDRLLVRVYRYRFRPSGGVVGQDFSASSTRG